MRLRSLITVFCLVLAARSGFVGVASAQELSFIRDAEIENTIRTWWTPIIKVAGLDPQAVHIYLVNDMTLNSFVAAGQNLFMNVGTLIRSDTPNQIVGIMAHETGHIAGGHLSRTDQALHNATIASIIAMAAGAAAAAVAHNAGAAGAALAGGEGVGERTFLAYSVTQEASADHAAMTFLDRTHMSARGLVQFFDILEQDELLSGQQEDPYVRTHPLTRDRVEYVRQHVAESKWSDVPDPPEWVEMHKRMKAKLSAFLTAPAMTLAKYQADDSSVAARYARAIAYYRIPQLDTALSLINGLIQQEPENPYFYELKGQMLFENGHVADAIPPYEQAVKLKPDIALLKIELSQVLLETDDQKNVDQAMTLLNSASPFESDDSDLWRLLAIAYGRSSNMGMASLSLAEEHMADGDWVAAKGEAQRAIKLLPPGAQRQRAEDISDDAQRSKDRGD